MGRKLKEGNRIEKPYLGCLFNGSSKFRWKFVYLTNTMYRVFSGFIKIHINKQSS